MKKIGYVNWRNFCLIAAIGVSMVKIAKAQSVDLVYSTEGKRWVSSKKFTAKTTGDTTITLYPGEQKQIMDGFGGAFNELGWDALSSLPASESNKIFKEMFSKEGANFSMCRIPLGASDYAMSYYTSNDVPEDFVMRDFNIDRDRYILIPYVKEALKYRPDLQVWASPWTPPAWMKVNEHYSLRRGDWNGRPNGNRMPEGAEIFNNATGFKMQERYLQAYALYFSKFAQAYKAEGVPLFAIMPQNEIAYAPNWPSCTWRAEDMAYFIGGYLGPQFEKDGLDTEIWLGSINSSKPDYVRTILNDKNAPKYLTGVGFQWGGSKSIPTINKEYPDYKFMQTENICGESENDWSSLERSWKTMVHYINNGAGSYIYWNMILDQTGMSAWGWPQNSMVVIDRDTKSVKFTDEYYLFKHFSHYIQPGDRLLKSSEGDNHLAFQKADGSIVLVMYNPNKSTSTKSVKIGEKTINLILQPKSVNTITIDNY